TCDTRSRQSFPTRRSSDLPCASSAAQAEASVQPLPWKLPGRRGHCQARFPERMNKWFSTSSVSAWVPVTTADRQPASSSFAPHRSEEHTSELQSREKLVCR